MQNIIFKPWIPDLYNSNHAKYGKLLLLGESHIGNEEIKNNSDFTINVIKEVIDGNRCRDYRHFTFLGNLITPDDRAITFKNCAYANLIQDVFSDARVAPSSGQFATIQPAFWKILNMTKPEKVIITSSRIWHNWMPDDDSRSRLIGEVRANDKHSTIWEYQYGSGSCEAIGIHHPSAMKFYSWRPLVQKFLES